MDLALAAWRAKFGSTMASAVVVLVVLTQRGREKDDKILPSICLIDIRNTLNDLTLPSEENVQTWC
jgi:hypothetical protein